MRTVAHLRTRYANAPALFLFASRIRDHAPQTRSQTLRGGNGRPADAVPVRRAVDAGARARDPAFRQRAKRRGPRERILVGPAECHVAPVDTRNRLWNQARTGCRPGTSR